MSDILEDRIKVPYQNATYAFRIPGIAYDLEVGYRAADIRRRYDPSGRGNLDGLDFAAARFAHCAALMELYLTEVDVVDHWPFTVGADGKPTVDHSKWPPKKASAVFAIGGAFAEKFARFCQDGPVDGQPPGEKAVDSVGNPGQPGQPVG